MSWIALSVDHIKARLAEDELEAYESTGGGDGDRLTGIIAQVTSLVRAKVGACDKNTLGAPGTIPEECLHSACTIARHNLLSSLSYNSDTDARKEEYREANSFLKEVARCDIAITTEDSTTVSGNDSGDYGGEPLHAF